jgi:hypothetical protein
MSTATLILWIGLGVALGGAALAAGAFTRHAWRSLRGVEESATKAFCTGCKSDLVSNGYFIGETDRGLVIYECKACKVESYWDFDAPTPLLIKPAPRAELPLRPPTE